MAATLTRNPGWLYITQHKKWFALLPVLIISLLTNYLQVNTIFNIDNYGSLDASWFLEMSQQWQQGNLLGRDIFFTYGPLSQWFAWLGVKLQGSTVLNGFSLGQMILAELGLVLLYLVICLIQDLDWLEALFVFAIMYVFCAFLPRPLSGLLAVAILIRALAEKSWRSYSLAALAGVLCFISQLLSIDFGILAFITCGGLIAFWLILALIFKYRQSNHQELKQPLDYIKIGLTTLGSFVGLNAGLLIYFRLSSPTYHWLDYWRYGIATLTRYNYAMGSDWLDDYTIRGPLLTVVVFLILVYTVYFSVVKIKEGIRGANPGLAYTISGLLLFAGINLKSALTRSDAGHLLYGLVGLMFIFSLSLVLVQASRKMLMVGVILLIQAISLWPFSGANYVQAWPNLLSQPASLTQQWQNIQSAQVNISNVVPGGLRKNITADKLIVSFPYNNIIPIALGHQTFAPVLQGYAAFDKSLQNLYIEKLESRLQDLEVIYGLETNSPRINGVQNISRLPIIFEYLARNFVQKVPQDFNGYIVLKPRATPVPLQRFPLAYQLSEFGPQSLQLDLGERKACDLIEVELIINYPAFALLGRPNNLTLKAWDADQLVQQSNLIAVETGVPFTTFVSLGKANDFGYIFSANRENTPATHFNKLVLSPGLVSLFDVQPNSIKVLNLNCIN